MSKRPLYGNWEFRAPDDEVIFYDSVKRANWYLERNLADVIEPNVIRLKFEPAGRRDPNDLYSLSKKSNRCVICNTDDLNVLTRHHIVPSEYRKFFPVKIKSRSSHDIIPICRKHHNEYETEASKLKLKLIKDYNIIINDKKDYNIHNALKLTSILLNKPNNIPKHRIEQIQADFKKYSNITHITKKSILEFIKNHKNQNIKTHGELIIEQVFKENKLYEFVQMWRQHFIDTMSPKYMPQYWNIERKLN